MLTQAHNAITATVNPSANIVDINVTWNSSGDVDLYVWEPNDLFVSPIRTAGFGRVYDNANGYGPERYTLNCSNLNPGRY
jgi:hypothetical protein